MSTINSDSVPVAFDSFEEAFARARFYEDRVDAVADYEELVALLNKKDVSDGG